MTKWPLLVALLAVPASLSPTFAASYAGQSVGSLGNLMPFEAIANDTLMLVEKGDLKAAAKRITDFESAWDKAEPTMRPKDVSQWGVIDDAADAAITSLRAKSPKVAEAKNAVSALIASLKTSAAN